MRHLLLWGGPVARADMKASLPAELTVLTVNHGVGGIGSSAFSDLALSYKGKDGRILGNLLAAVGLSVDDFDDISIAGFSAFHGLANHLLLSDGDLITAAVMLDACFSAKDHLEKSGFVAFGARAALGDVLLVMSGSLGGGDTYSTGVQCIVANDNAAARSAGVVLHEATLPEGVPAPAEAWQSKSLFVLDYQKLYTHGGHVHHLGKPLLEGFLGPWLAHRSYPGEDVAGAAVPAGPRWVLGLGLVAFSAALVVATTRINDDDDAGREGDRATGDGATDDRAMRLA